MCVCVHASLFHGLTSNDGGWIDEWREGVGREGGRMHMGGGRKNVCVCVCVSLYHGLTEVCPVLSVVSISWSSLQHLPHY